ncbi:MAG: hypothetical protein Kow0031_11380 [Anaerolineae bacterium]
MRTFLKLGFAVLLATGWLLVAFVLLGDGVSVSHARLPAGLTVGSDIVADTTWQLADSPITLTTGITVTGGAVLTIEQGVIVRSVATAELKILGHLHAVGTPALPITFTAVDPAQRWGGLLFDGGTGYLKHVDILFGGRANSFDQDPNPERAGVLARNVLTGQIYIESSRILSATDNGGLQDSGIYLENSRLTLSDTMVALNGNSAINGYGLYAAPGSSTVLTVTNSRFLSNTATGLLFDTTSGAVITVTGSLFQGNGFFGMYIDPGVTAHLAGNTFNSNGSYPLQTDAANLHQVLNGGNTFFGNNPDVFLTRGTLQADVTFNAASGLTGFELDDDVIVPNGVTLTVNPGTIIYGQSGSEVLVGGRLEAMGVATNPITFTSVTGSGGNEWSGLVFNGGSGDLRHATVRYGGQINSRGWRSSVLVQSGGVVTLQNSSILTGSNPITDYGLLIFNARAILSDSVIAGNGDQPTDYAVHISGPSPALTMTGSCVTNNEGVGIFLVNGQLSISGSDFSGNGQRTGLINDSPTPVSARFNWWGHPGGPTHPGNPTGQGEIITGTGTVDYSDWAEEPVCQSYLRLAKQAPDTALAGKPITYTLTIFNRSPVTATNVVITDAVPAGAAVSSILNGGSAISGGQVVRWQLPTVPARGSETVQFIVTGSQPIVNRDYRATAADGSTARGIYPVETIIVRGGSGELLDSGQRLGSRNSLAVVKGDIDGDGDLDVIVGNGSPNQVWLNDGSGSFNPDQTVGDGASQAISLDDLDGDNDPDLFIGNSDGSNEVWLNDGSGTFTPGPTFGGGNTQAIALGDLNGDGTVDAFTANSSGNQVWLNNGSGAFTADTSQTPGSSGQAVALADIDADGDLDAVVGTGNGQPNQVWLNNGSGVFSDTIALDSGNAQAIALGDLDQNGTIDVVLANGGGQPDQVWLNGGGGVFTPGNSFGNSNSQAVALGDLDADGDLDIFIGTASGEPSRVWLNDGAGSFTLSAQILDANDAQAVVIGDFDGDGDLDTFIANGGSGVAAANRVYFNRNRQVVGFGPAGGTLIDVSNGLTTVIVIPPGALSQATTFTFTLLTAPTPPVSPTLRFGGRGFGLTAAQSGQPFSGPFNPPLTVTVHFSSAGLVNPNGVTLRYRDAAQQVWLDAAAGCSATGRASGVLTVGVCHLTEFALFEPNSAPYFVTGTPLVTPTGGITLSNPRPVFAWQPAADDKGVVSYTLTLTGGGVVAVTPTTTSAYTPTVDLAGGVYTWTVRAFDEAGLASAAVAPAVFAVTREGGGSKVFLPVILKAH